MKRLFRGCLRSVLVTACGFAVVLAAVLIPILIAVYDEASLSDEDYIAGIIGVQLPAYAQKTGEDAHGGFHGDGSAWYLYGFDERQTELLEKSIGTAAGWRRLPMTPQSERFLFGGNADGMSYAPHAGASGFILPEEGYWFFLDEQAEKEACHNDNAFLDRHSINVKYAVYDARKGLLLFYELDT